MPPMLRSRLLICLVTFFTTSWCQAEERIQLPVTPALSPDGHSVVFSHRGDLWIAPTSGGTAQRLTSDPANDFQPRFSPDGKTIAFISERTGSRQVFLMPATGGIPTQVTHHTSGFHLHGWSPDGEQLLVSGTRDYFWRRAERMFWIRKEGRTAEIPLFDDYGYDPSVSPDGKKILFTREGDAWWRKGYRGSQASQIWLFNTEDQSFQLILTPEGGARWPLWKADGSGFFYVNGDSGVLNLHSYNLETKSDEPLTTYKDDSVVFPALSADGRTMIFRKLFDLYRYDVNEKKAPEKITLTCTPDIDPSPMLRRTFTTATSMATTKDGLEIALIAGGDVWVMETELREPVQITFTPEEERDVVFSPNGDAIWFISDAGGQTDLWKATRADEKSFWWENSQFVLTKITNDPHPESQIRFSPDGSKLAFTRNEELWIADADGSNQKRFLTLRSTPRYDWSPDGKWICYSTIDDDYNSDIWIAPLDESRPPYNLSRSPGNDGEPRWSPNGKMIAFTGLRDIREVDLFIVHLLAPEYEKNSRDRKRESTISKFNRTRKTGKADEKPSEDKTVQIDFEGIHNRIQRISIPNSNESNLLWSPDSKKLAFASTVEGKRGTYTIEFPEGLKPSFVTTSIGSRATWISEGNQILWLVNGVPTSMVPGGKVSTYSFAARQEMLHSDRMRAGFELAWRIMRDQFYDPQMNNLNWDDIRRKYIDAAAASTDERQLATVISLMLGELNASHMGFTPTTSSSGSAEDEFENEYRTDITINPPSSWGTSRHDDEPQNDPSSRNPSSWRPVTAHLGVRFDHNYQGPGLKIRDVIPEGPASYQVSRLLPGEIILSIDGTAVDPAFDLTQVLNGRLDRQILLLVRGTNGEERTVSLRPTSYGTITPKLYDMWVEQTRQMVEELSNGTLGYLHIKMMNNDSFNRFMEDLAFAGAGKDGLIIDVRENGGGSIADHLLTSLTQPVHAWTLGRVGGIGYPQDRKIYPTWHKPIIVLCNQNSFSNAEIFSHAIKTLKRGKLVGVPTAGGVISTSSARVMDLGTIRTPTRGWYVLETGEDMELNGAVPDIILWPEPGQMPAGEDIQLKRAIEELNADVAEWKSRPLPQLRKASERRR